MDSFDRMIEKANEAIVTAHPNSAVYIGCDSMRFKKNGIWYAKYSVVIILHKECSKGGQLFHSLSVEKDYGAMKQRLMNEAQLTIRAFEGVVDSCLENDIGIHIHLDLNPDPKHKSNIAVKEACGWVLGSTGISPDIKPASWAASSAADHAVRGKIKIPVEIS